ncbi:hypothetical protein CTA2_5051 [Colletotrichum tanaceti]|nr:hypothetical protein CTA2_5051 [Colletotrichum tanaceti]
MHRMPSRAQGGSGGGILPRSQIEAVLGEIAAGDDQADAGADRDPERGVREVQRDQLRVAAGVAVQPPVLLRDVARPAAGVDDAQADKEVAERVVARVDQVHGRPPHDVEGVRQRRRGEGDDVGPLRQGRVVDAAPADHDGTADGRRGVRRVKGEGNGARARDARVRRLLGAEVPVRREEQFPMARRRRPLGHLEPLRRVAAPANPDGGKLVVVVVVVVGRGFPGEMGVEPPERLPRRIPRVVGVQVGPGADPERDGAAPPVQRVVLLDGLLEGDVVPAGREQDGNVGPLERLAVPQRRPALVVQVRTADVAEQPRGPVAKVAPQRGLQRHALGQRVEVAGVSDGRELPPEAARLLVRHGVAPREVLLQGEGAGAPEPLGVVVGRDADDGGDQVGRGVREQGPLREAREGRAQGRKGAGVPGLRPHPGDDVLAVAGLAAPAVEDARRAEGAAGADQEDLVPPGRVDADEKERGDDAAAVGGPHENGTEGAVVVGRPVQVGGECGAVREGYLDGLGCVAGGFGRKTEGPPDGPVEESGQEGTASCGLFGHCIVATTEKKRRKEKKKTLWAMNEAGKMYTRG